MQVLLWSMNNALQIRLKIQPVDFLYQGINPSSTDYVNAIPSHILSLQNFQNSKAYLIRVISVTEELELVIFYMGSDYFGLTILFASGQLLHKRCFMDCDGVLWRGKCCRSDKGNRSGPGGEVHSICVL